MSDRCEHGARKGTCDEKYHTGEAINRADLIEKIEAMDLIDWRFNSCEWDAERGEEYHIPDSGAVRDHILKLIKDAPDAFERVG